MLVLAIESSTSSAKAMLYDSEKGVVDSAQKNYGPLVSKNGKTDTDKVYHLTMQMARKIAEGKEIAAIALCGTWHSLSVCNESLVPLTPTFSWDFTESAPFCEEMRENEELTDRLYRNTGCMPHNTYPRHVLSYLKNQGFYLRDKKFITQGGYNFFRLTGEFLETPCTQSGTGVLNLNTLDYDEFTLDYFEIEKKQLGTLATFEDVRPLSKEGAAELGIKAEIPVLPAHADGALNQVGNYANRKGIMTMSVGTSGAIRVAADEPVTPKGRQLWCYYGVNRWISGAAISGACNCVDWFMKRMLCGESTYQAMEQVQDETADVPVFLPFLFGERCPGWRDDRRGGFLYIENNHTLPDFYKGLRMGILFNLYQCYQILCEEGKQPEQMIVSGGITNSRTWTQMVADIFEQDVLVAEHADASSMGAIALALHAAGELENIDDFQTDFRLATKVSCNKETFDYYKRQYARYKEAYGEGLYKNS